MPKQMFDIGLDSSEDLAIKNNDFVTTESTAQHQQQLILNNKGDFKQNPTVCVGAFNFLDDENYNELIRAISIEFSKDGMDVKSIKLNRDGYIISDAFYR